MIQIIFIVIVVSIILTIISSFKKSSIFNKLLSVNSLASYMIILIALIANSKGNNSLIDIALIYGLINFVGTIAFLKYFKYKSF